MASIARRLSFEVPPGLVARVCARYEEPHRRHYGLDHLVACFDARVRLVDAPMPAVDLALLFHDAVYEPLATDNEARSAALLEEACGASFDRPTVLRAKGFVLATRHRACAATFAEGVVLDADLSVLGASPEAFAAYERGVREEYGALDDVTFAEGRRRFLAAMLARPTLFSTPAGRDAWEATARRNLEASVRGVGTVAGSAATVPPRR